MTDEFQTRTSSYSEDEFYTRSVNDKGGQSSLLHCKVPPWIAAKLEEIITSHHFPYRTIQDIMRDALHHRVHYLNGKLKSPVIDSVERQLMLMHRTLQESGRKKEYEDYVRELVAIMENHVTTGSTPEAKRIINSAYEDAQGIPDEYWRKRYITAIEERFGHLLD